MEGFLSVPASQKNSYSDLRTLSTSAQISHLLVTRRKELGLTQAEVAARLCISQNRLSELENRPTLMTVDRLLALVGILGIELAASV
ncbi:MAG: helix-turn-helix domain-containing protein [Pusillimonas sp.]